MGLDEHYDRAEIEGHLAAKRELEAANARGISSQAVQWNEALAAINSELGSDFRRFVAAMRKHGKKRQVPGAKFHLLDRPLRLGTRTLWYWELSPYGAFSGEDNKRIWHGTLVLIDSAALVIDVWSRPNRRRSTPYTPGPASRHARFAREMPSVLLQRVDPSMSTPPTSSDIGAALATLLRTHSVLLD